MVSGTSSYACKKWGLFTFTLIAFISNLAITTLESLAIDDLTEDDLGIHRTELNNVKTTLLAVTLTLGVVSIVIQLVGLVGAFKENYCMVITYAVCATIIAAFNIAVAIWQPFDNENWFSVVVYFLISILAYSYARDIKNKLQEQNQTIIVVQHPSVLYSTPGQSYPTPLFPQNQAMNGNPGQSYQPFPRSQYSGDPPAYENEQGGIQMKPVTSL